MSQPRRRLAGRIVKLRSAAGAECGTTIEEIAAKAKEEGKPEAALDIRVLLSANAALVLLLGLFPDGLMSLCIKVFQ